MFGLFGKKSQESEILPYIIDDVASFQTKEAFNALSTNVMYLPIMTKCKKIAVTSANQNEGKSYVSINLALSLAKNLADKKVLFIDMDLRNSSLAEYFNLYDSAKYKTDGVTEYLLGISEKPNVISSDVEGLDVFFAGGKCQAPQELISSKKLEVFISECEEKYDYIIIDTPPVNVVSDTKLLTPLVSGYIITAREGYSSVKELRSAVSALKLTGANVFGTVLTANRKNKAK